MGFVYSAAIIFYSFLVFILSFFNKKAKLWHEGQKNIFKKIERANLTGPVVWFHFASLGEFEQGRPVLEKFKQIHPQKKLIVTFFSPSGYEIRKDYPIAELVLYLPLDTKKNAKKFIRMLNPEFAVFTKYEYWYNFYKELHKNQIPVYVISAIFRKDYSFFKWYGFLNRTTLSYVSHFFVQDERSKELLKTLKITCVTVSGDTRFDRVFDNAKNPKKFPIVEQFCNLNPVFVAGSTWPEDETLIATLPEMYPDWKFIIVPHEIGEEKISNLCKIFHDSVRYSELEKSTEKNGDHDFYQISNLKSQILIIDNVGMLSSLYQYGNIAYIGGGFGAGIHNTLEAAAFGLPVIFGPNYHKFLEAQELIKLDAAFSIKNDSELRKIAKKLQNEDYKNKASLDASEYVKTHIGATRMIIDTITRKMAN